MSYKPVDYNSVSPYLIVHDVPAVIDFLERTLDASPLRRHLHADGSIMHAEVRIGDSVIMLGGAQPDWPNSTCHVHIYVPDVDETHARALANGAEEIQAPIRKDGEDDKRGGVKGPAGNSWWFATVVR